MRAQVKGVTRIMLLAEDRAAPPEKRTLWPYYNPTNAVMAEAQTAATRRIPGVGKEVDPHDLATQVAARSIVGPIENFEGAPPWPKAVADRVAFLEEHLCPDHRYELGNGISNGLDYTALLELERRQREAPAGAVPPSPAAAEPSTPEETERD